MFLPKSNNDSYAPNNNTNTNIVNSARLINKKRKKINALNLKVIDTSDRNEYYIGSIETYTRSSNDNISTIKLENYEKPNKSEKKRKKKININKLINDTHLESNCQNKYNELRKTNYNVDSNSVFSSDKNLIKFNELNPTCETNRNVDDNKMKYQSELSSENSNDLNHKNKLNYKTQILKRKIKIIHHTNKSNDSINEENNIKYIIKIQANFRRYILKKKLYNSLRIYMRYIQAIFLLKKVFLNNINVFIEKIIRKKIDKTYTNLSLNNFEYDNNNELRLKIEKIIEENKGLKLKNFEYKMIKDKYDNIVKENKRMININHKITQKNRELQKQLKDIEKKNNEKDKKMTKNAKKNNEKNITNNYTIQSQVNIYMTKPVTEKKEEEKKIKLIKIKKKNNNENESVKKNNKEKG